jgi:hypothetical protein
MSMLGIVVMLVFVGLGLVFLNRGPGDKEFERRQAYWARFTGK